MIPPSAREVFTKVKTKRIIKSTYLPLVCIALFTLTSCLEERQTESASKSQTSFFDGVKSVKNLGGFPPAVKIEWSEATTSVSGYRIYSLLKNPTTSVNEWTAISDILPPETTSYLHSAVDQVISGQIVTYKVKAVDLSNKEDSNNKQLATIVFDGIQDVQITGKSSATVSISSSVGSFNEVRIYAQPLLAGAVKKLVATAVGNLVSIPVAGLQSGVNYKFYASAFIASFSAEDGNEVYRTAQTHSDGFGSGNVIDTNFSFQNVRLVQGFGSAPNVNPITGPVVRQLTLVWNPFIGATSETKYRIIRGSGQSKLDTTSTTNCTSTTNTSCVVCTKTGSGPQNCTDTNLAAPPKKYDYAITLIKKNTVTNEEWAEELPTTNFNDFVVSAQVPSNYMTLVHRESVNYEICYQMKRAPDPRKKNRCAYSGIGAAPYNSGPGKPPLTFEIGYYDFGYNLLVDRHMLACNWTRNSCGPNGCIGPTFVDANLDSIPEGSAPPSNAIGNNNDIYFAINSTTGSNCYIKNAGIWRDVAATTTNSSLMALASTTDPGPADFRHRPVIHNMSPEGAQQICRSQNSDYGTKRIMRRREFIAASPISFLEGEPDALTNLTDRWRKQLAFPFADGQTTIGNNFGCANIHQGETNLSWVTSITDLINPTNERAFIRLGAWANSHNRQSEPFFIGSSATRNCKSRFGMRDPYSWEGYGIWFSDQFAKQTTTATTPIYRGELSDLDDGARDFLGFDFNNTTLGATITDGSITSSNYYQNTTSGSSATFPYYLPHLGIPLFGGNAGQNLFNYNDYMQSGEFGPGLAGIGGILTSTALLRHPWWNSGTLGFFMSSDRVARASQSFTVRSNTGWMKAWCAVEAE